jgi:replication factor C subunit 2/4
MRILEGVGTLVQLGALIARLSKVGIKPELFKI